jgi:hypothetical protein
VGTPDSGLGRAYRTSFEPHRGEVRPVDTSFESQTTKVDGRRIESKTGQGLDATNKAAAPPSTDNQARRERRTGRETMTEAMFLPAAGSMVFGRFATAHGDASPTAPRTSARRPKRRQP